MFVHVHRTVFTKPSVDLTHQSDIKTPQTLQRQCDDLIEESVMTSDHLLCFTSTFSRHKIATIRNAYVSVCTKRYTCTVHLYMAALLKIQRPRLYRAYVNLVTFSWLTGSTATFCHGAGKLPVLASSSLLNTGVSSRCLSGSV